MDKHFTLARLFALFPSQTVSKETYAAYADALKETRDHDLERGVRWLSQHWKRKEVPPVACVIEAVDKSRAESRSERIDPPVLYAAWERGLDFNRDPMPHGHFIRDLTLPDGSAMRVMSEHLIGPDGVHRGYPNEQSRRWNGAYERAHPNARLGPMDKLVRQSVAQTEPGWNG